MRYVFKLATSGMILLGSFMQLASAQVIVYVGYLDTFPGGALDPADIPMPFEPNETTTSFISGGLDKLHDTGVLWFENFSDAPVTIDHVRVVTQDGFFKIWDDVLPFILEPRRNLVLAATVEDPKTDVFNFDSSDFGLSLNPVVIGTVDGTQFTCVDIDRVLLGREEARERDENETTPYRLLAVVGANEQLATETCFQSPTPIIIP